MGEMSRLNFGISKPRNSTVHNVKSRGCPFSGHGADAVINVS